MSASPPGFELVTDNRDCVVLRLTGDWLQDAAQRPDFADVERELHGLSMQALVADAGELGEWDSILAAFLLQVYQLCRDAGADFSTRQMPDGLDRLLGLAMAVPRHRREPEPRRPWYTRMSGRGLLRELIDRGNITLGFIGEIALAFGNLLRGRSNTRFSDFRECCYQAGPDAFAIISLTSILVGMILAYLGAVQLLQFGAEIYVADLVVIGTLREMGVLMTAVVMAGRTGAAYAAQLGSMQANDEIDAVVTMGISPMEFLVLPRILALMVMMPLLTLYANLLGIIGGGIVAGGMGITPLMYIHEGQTALTLTHLNVGLAKSVVFGLLIAVAGCRAGINCGRSSSAVGQAATEAVVTAIVYLIIADAAFNIIFQQLEI